jgi:hypothetical protein
MPSNDVGSRAISSKVHEKKNTTVFIQWSGQKRSGKNEDSELSEPAIIPGYTIPLDRWPFFTKEKKYLG